MATRKARAEVRQNVDIGLRRYLLNIYTYMALGLALTALVALSIGFAPAPIYQFFSSISLISTFATLGIAIYFGMAFNRLSPAAAQFLFWTYAITMGMTLFWIFDRYHPGSIARVFFVTAATFGATSIYGFFTQKDLTSVGTFCFMGLIGMIIAGFVNVFFRSTGLDLALSVIGVVVFVGLTAYDTQRLKSIYYQMPNDETVREKVAIMGALSLYLDVINLFLSLLRLMGDRK